MLKNIKVNKSRAFGVEIEFASTPDTALLLIEKLKASGLKIKAETYNHRARTYWKLTTDSSVHPNSGANFDFDGYELVSPKLTLEDGGMEQIQKIFDAINSINSGLLDTNRQPIQMNDTSSIHVHYNAIDFSITTFKNLLNLYYKYEHIIDKIHPESRRENYFCKTLKTDYFKTGMERAKTVSSLLDEFEHRYKKLNIESFNRHCTVEFRQHGPTTDIMVIKNWILFCNLLIARALQKNFVKMDYTKQPTITNLRDELSTYAHQDAEPDVIAMGKTYANYIQKGVTY